MTLFHFDEAMIHLMQLSCCNIIFVGVLIFTS